VATTSVVVHNVVHNCIEIIHMRTQRSISGALTYLSVVSRGGAVLNLTACTPTSLLVFFETCTQVGTYI
jgi:hypothetical protein